MVFGKNFLIIILMRYEWFALFSIFNKPSKCIPDLLLFSRNIITHESFPKVICHSWLKITLIAVIITQHKNYNTIRTIFKNAHFPITNSYSCIFPRTKPIALKTYTFTLEKKCMETFGLSTPNLCMSMFVTYFGVQDIDERHSDLFF